MTRTGRAPHTAPHPSPRATLRRYVDLNTGILLARPLLAKVSDPAECKDQKGGGGTFDMFDAKLGNCVFYLGSRPQKLPGFENQPPCDERRAGDVRDVCTCPAVGGPAAVTYAKAGPRSMVSLSLCAGLIDHSTATALDATIARTEWPLSEEQVSVHVMARETQLEQIVNDCEGTWAANVSKVYYHVDKSVASEAYTISRGRWGISPNLVTASDDGGKKKRAKGDGDDGRQHRVAALNLPARPNTQGEHWTISSTMIT